MANKILSSNVKLALNTAFDKLLRIAGLPENYLDFSFADQINVGPYTTTEDMDLYVDPVLGSDTNPGTQALPFKTIQATLTAVPKIIRHGVIVHLAAGTHYSHPASWTNTISPDSTINVSGFVFDNTCQAGSVTDQFSYLHIEGAFNTVASDLTASAGTPVTTVDPTCTITVANAGWTPNQFQGMFIEILSGATGLTAPYTGAKIRTWARPNVFPIFANDTQTISFIGGQSPPGVTAGTIFNILDAATIINGAASGVSPLSRINVDVAGSSAVDRVNGIVSFRYLKLNGFANARNGCPKFYNCAFVAGGFTNFLFAQTTAYAAISRCYFADTLTGAVNYEGSCTISDCYLGTTTNSSVIGAVSLFGSFGNYTSVQLTSSVIKNNGSSTGIVLNGVVSSNIFNCKILTTAGNAVQLLARTYSTVKSCSGNTGTAFGIAVRDGSICQIDANTSVTGTAGDMTLDGSTALTYTALRAASPTAQSNTTELSRIWQ